jgi:hypothetical protein
MTMSVTPTIEELIQQANNPEDRAMLVVLNKMANSLDANTAMTKAVSTRLEEHISDFQKKVRADDAIKNKGMGAWKVLAWLLGGAQVLVGWGLVEARAEAGKMMSAIAAHQQFDAQLRMELVNVANNSTNADLRQANRIDLLEARCARVENARSGK